MKCKKCGAQLPEGAAFCGGCGSPVEATKKKMPMAAIGIAIAVVLVIVIAVVAILLLGKKDKGDAVSADAAVVGDATGDNAIAGDLVEINPAELTPLYNITDVATIDIYAQNYMPGTKQEGIKWDSTLFYWLEDIDRSSSEDGYLSRCKIGKTMLRNAENGQLVQYEIYRDPNTSEIYKIVSIEQAETGWKITDYYYSGGKPNFIFVRHDSVYTPTYATTDKTGERFYFHQDVLARWRMIRVPGEIGEYVLTPTENVWYSQANYFTETTEVQQAYNNIEMRMLNAAYNTFNAVSAQSVGIIEGKVQDTTGSGLGSLTVDVLRKSDNALLYRGTTAEDGTFRILTYLDNSECYILVRGNETYKEAAVYGVFLADSGITNAYCNLLLHKVGGDEYPVHINVYSAADVRTGEDGSLVKNLLAGSKVSVRAGVGAYTGEVLLTAEADVEGRVHANLQSGSYTLQIETPGYSVSYLEVEVAEQETTVEGYVLPALQEDKTGIVLTWDGADVDLDLTLFTPYQSTGGDMAHIGSTIPGDGHGNQLVADNGAGCEVMYVNTAELGNYKLYVNNYTDSQSGNYNSNVLGTLNVHIYIYDINGFVAEYSFPVGQTGVVWEVVDISGKQLTPSNRVYNQIEGKSWWMESKEALNIEECKDLQVILEILVNFGEWRDSSALYQGDLSVVSYILEDYLQMRVGGCPWGCSYFESLRNTEGAKAAIDEYRINQGYEQGYYEESIAYTLEQVNYIMSAVTGRSWSIANLADIVGDSYEKICGDYVVYELFAYLEGRIFLENYQTDYIGGNQWIVTADGMVRYPGSPKYQAVQLTATVFRNPDSCFDGFSVIDFDVEECRIAEWTQAYYDYLINHPEYASHIDGEYQADYMGEGYLGNEFNILYVDDDSIPEIYVQGTSYAGGDQLLYYHNGQVYEEYFCNYGGSYIPRSGKMLDSGGHMGGYYDRVMQLAGGKLETIAEGTTDYNDDFGYTVEDENGNMILQRATWNELEISTIEEYSMLLNDSFDTAKSKECNGGDGYIGDIDLTLDFLYSTNKIYYQ